MNSCAVCNAPSTKQCAACLVVYYCSKEHQKQDWKNHRDTCLPYKAARGNGLPPGCPSSPAHPGPDVSEHQKQDWKNKKDSTCLPYEMKEDASLGPILVAARQLAAGELVVKENPFTSVTLVSSLKQSCIANCFKVTESTGEIIVRAAQPIAPGEHLSLCYVNPLVGTRERVNLLNRFMCSCICIRCLDPTELGTHFSSLKCRKTGCSGLLVPPNAARRFNNQPWKCQSCHEQTSAPLVEKLISSVFAALSSLDKTNFADCQDFINRFEPYLHENHFLLTEGRLAATQGPRTLNLTEDDWKVQLKYCRQLDQLLSKLASTENKIRGFILIRMSTALFNIDGNDNVEDAKKVAITAYELLKHELDVPGNILDALRLGRKVPMPAVAKAFELLKFESDEKDMIRRIQQMMFEHAFSMVSAGH